MSGKGKRRSARLLKLEEQKNDNTACQIDPWQVIENVISGSSSRGKGKKSEQFQVNMHQEASCSRAFDATSIDNLSSSGMTGKIIEYILDVLEVRDTHELFTMPDDIQVTDYAERVNKPSDLATLRQKNRDGMYKTLEQFENDICMVFQKAMSINHQDTIPYREAMRLQDQAKQVFQSLKNNRMYSESELSTWHHNYFNRAKKPRRSEGGNGRPKKRSTDQRQEKAKANSGAGNERREALVVQESKTVADKRTRKAPTPTAESSEKCPDQRRLTYVDEPDPSSPAPAPPPPPVLQHRPTAGLVFNPHGRAYRSSLHGFVRDAGLKARVAVEFRSLECTARARRDVIPVQWQGYTPNSCAPFQLPAPSHEPPHRMDDDAPVPDCKLETDDLLRHLLLIGTPEFLKAGRKTASTRQEEEPQRDSNLEERPNGLANEAASSPFAPPRLVPGRLGFGQFARSTNQPFKLKPSDSSASNKHG